MEIVTIRNLSQFDGLKADWEAAYQMDRQATICMSWPWLRGWLEETPNEWMVLAVRPDGNAPFVGFLPLATASGCLFMAGTPLADYTGFVCWPEYETRAMKAWAMHIDQKLDWNNFVWTNSMDRRAEAFLGRFSGRRFKHDPSEVRPCPYIQLPATWDAYLESSIGPTTARDIRRSMKKLETGTQYRLTQADEQTIEPHLQQFLGAWQARWCLPGYYLEGYRQVLRRAHVHSMLWLGMLWDQDKLIGGLAGFLERDRQTFTACLTTADRSYSQLRPGKTIYGYGIRHAIEQGCRIFDFTQGDEDYKFALGAVARQSPSFELTRRTRMMALKEARDKLEAVPILGRFAQLTHFRQLGAKLKHGMMRLAAIWGPELCEMELIVAPVIG